jgi:hypothetical protein
MGLFEVTWDKLKTCANNCGLSFSIRESGWGAMGEKGPNIVANETLYQLSYTPRVTNAI